MRALFSYEHASICASEECRFRLVSIAPYNCTIAKQYQVNTGTTYLELIPSAHTQGLSYVKICVPGRALSRQKNYNCCSTRYIYIRAYCLSFHAESMHETTTYRCWVVIRSSLASPSPGPPHGAQSSFSHCVLSAYYEIYEHEIFKECAIFSSTWATYVRTSILQL